MGNTERREKVGVEVDLHQSKVKQLDGCLQVPSMHGWEENQFGEGNYQEDRDDEVGVSKAQVSAQQP